MENRKQRGILTSWKDDKGFGFIKPDRGKAEVFIHISALKRSVRRPRVGDVIFYDLTTEDNGKVRACNASIQGVVSEPAPQKHKRKNHKFFPKILILIA
jgi:cold shock CspA family protein